MLFVKIENLKVGMRIAKPIYNKKGVLLFDRDSKLTDQGIDSVKNFGLIGLYILEPAEPLPPMSPEDIEFERFQTVAAFQIQDELDNIVSKHKSVKIYSIVDEIIRRYGRLTSKINFVQNLRSNDDYVYKHSLNCAMLCAMIGHAMNIKVDERTDCVTAAILHDIGKLEAPKEVKEKGTNLEGADRAIMDKCEKEGQLLIQDAFSASPAFKRIVMQAHRIKTEFAMGKESLDTVLAKMVTPAKILVVADAYDTLTAMNDYREPSSEIGALKYLQEHPEIYDKKAVEGLVKSINFLSNGCCVELNNGQKGLVLAANDEDVLHPMVLQFSNNSIIDLARNSMGIEINDVMKTMDNRCVIDKDALKGFG